MALIVAEDLRIDVDGVPVCDGLTFETRGQSELILAAPRALFEALAGLRPVVRGALRIDDVNATTAVRQGMVASAALDPPLPPTWTVFEYVVWSSRLAGHSARDARGLANEAIGRASLEAMSTHALARLNLHARRGVVLAAALATGARTIVLEDPLAALPEEIARSWARILVRALEGRAWIVLAGRLTLTSPLVMNAEEAIIVSSNRVAAQGPPAEIVAHHGQGFMARIHGPIEALREKLVPKGAKLDVHGAQALIHLGDSMTIAELLGLACEADVTIVELVPLSHALA